ncbi:hypothetical protein B0H19DRAFT_1242975 [Mycena capillaripes]|nr:hypothetical protein B0H19DRAFT_1242975 [Mycena capillaripes]
MCGGHGRTARIGYGTDVAGGGEGVGRCAVERVGVIQRSGFGTRSQVRSISGAVSSGCRIVWRIAVLSGWWWPSSKSDAAMPPDPGGTVGQKCDSGPENEVGEIGDQRRTPTDQYVPQAQWMMPVNFNFSLGKSDDGLLQSKLLVHSHTALLLAPDTMAYGAGFSVQMRPQARSIPPNFPQAITPRCDSPTLGVF